MKKAVTTILMILGYLLAIFLVNLILMSLSKSIFSNLINRFDQTKFKILHEGLVMVLSIVVINISSAHFFDSRLFKSGWPRIKIGAKGFLKGGLVGVLTAVAMLVLTILLGGGMLEFQNFVLTKYVSAISPLLIILLISSLGEEWLFRGYPLTVLSRLIGNRWAIFVFAMLFAVVHLGSNGMNAYVFINIIIGGSILGALRFTKGGIPTAWGFHFVWNSTQVMLGVTLSGEDLDVPGISFIPTSNPLLSGGDLGPEGSLGATIATLIALAISIIYVCKYRNHD